MSEDDRGNADNPGVIAPPPLIYAGALIAGDPDMRFRFAVDTILDGLAARATA